MAVKGWKQETLHGGRLLATLDLVSTDTSTALRISGWAQMCLHVIPGVGVTITDLDVKGSNFDSTPGGITDNALYRTLHQAHDPSTLTFDNIVTALLADIFENPEYIKVTSFTATGGSTDAKIVVVGYTSR